MTEIYKINTLAQQQNGMDRETNQWTERIAEIVQSAQ